ncbi:MAG: DUF1996 domain-containing protein, partial [Actinomycetota bacterium]
TPTAYHVIALDDVPHKSWGRSRIGWLVECERVKYEQVDPIVSPGRPSGHLHEFFGNGNIGSTLTTQQLLDTPQRDIACSDTNDRSGYWAPAVYQGDRRIEADVFKAYYKSTTTDTVPMPLGLRMIAGDAGATKNQKRHVGFWEQQRKSTDKPNQAYNTAGSDRMITRIDDERMLVLRMNYPNCWDGKHLDSPDHQSHVAYADHKTQACPASHPHKIPQLTTFTRYDTDGGEDFRLSSGAWHTFHQDFWNGWDPTQMDELNQLCIHGESNCRVRGSSNLKKHGQYVEFVPAR